MLPENWQNLRLLDICRPRQWPTISKDKFTPDGFPVYGANGQIGYYSEYTHAHETIAITCRGATCGTINVVPAMSYITGNAMALDAVNNKIVSQDYLYHSLNHWGVADSITGSAQPQITRESLSKVEFPFPPLPEQRRIAEILGSVDAAIEATKAVIEQTKTVKQGLLQTLLTRGIGHTEFQDSPLGEIPKGWEVRLLGEICDFKSGIGFPEKYQGKKNGEFGFLKVSDLNLPSNERYINTSNNTVDMSDVKALRAQLFPTGAVIFPKVGAALLSNRRRIIKRPVAIDNNMMAAIPRKATSEYLYYILTEIDFAQMVQPGAVPSINKGMLDSIPIRLPSLKEQEKICGVLASFDTNEDVSAKELYALFCLKRGLMSDLLTGKVRVDV